MPLAWQLAKSVVRLRIRPRSTFGDVRIFLAAQQVTPRGANVLTSLKAILRAGKVVRCGLLLDFGLG